MNKCDYNLSRFIFNEKDAVRTFPNLEKPSASSAGFDNDEDEKSNIVVKYPETFKTYFNYLNKLIFYLCYTIIIYSVFQCNCLIIYFHFIYLNGISCMVSSGKIPVVNSTSDLNIFSFFNFKQ